MAKSEARLQARILRRRGASVDSIAATLNVSKSSVSNWCRDVPLSAAQKQRLKENSIKAGGAGRLKGAETNRNRRLAKIQSGEERGRELFSKLSPKEFLVAGAAIYWGEGSKTDHLSFINSDPAMVLFMMQWFKGCFGIRADEFMPRIFINEVHRSRTSTVVTFWSKKLGIPAVQFRKTILIKGTLKKKYENHSKYYGLLSLRIKASSDLKYRILGLIEGLKNSKLPASPV